MVFVTIERSRQDTRVHLQFTTGSEILSVDQALRLRGEIEKAVTEAIVIDAPDDLYTG